MQCWRNNENGIQGIETMKLTKILTGFSAACLVAFMAIQPVQAAEEEGGTPHYPINHPKHVHWSFSGIFGHWDHQQLQRGLQVYKEVCSACHSMNLVAFRNLEELGYTEEEVRAFAKEYTVTDGPNNDGDMYERAAVPSDHFPSPFPNVQAAAASNNGAAPPDFSLLAKARAPERGFPTFIFDIFTAYAENGPDYIYSLLTGYQDPPAGFEMPEGGHYNPYFIGGPTLAMAPPLSDEIVEYEDGTPMTVDQYAKDVASFMMWAAEPTLVQRKSMGFKVILFLLLLAALVYLTKKAIFSSLKAGGPAAASAYAGGAVASAPMGESAATGPASASLVSGAPPSGAANTPTASELRAGVDYIDDIELIDGIGATIAKRLRAEGVNSLSTIASMASSDLASLAEKVNAKGRPEREEWQEQARELISGQPPRAQVDRLKVEKMLNKTF